MCVRIAGHRPNRARHYEALYSRYEDIRSCLGEGDRIMACLAEEERRVMSLRELWSPETVAPKIRHDLNRLAGK